MSRTRNISSSSQFFFYFRFEFSECEVCINTKYIVLHLIDLRCLLFQAPIFWFLWFWLLFCLQPFFFLLSSSVHYYLFNKSQKWKSLTIDLAMIEMEHLLIFRSYLIHIFNFIIVFRSIFISIIIKKKLLFLSEFYFYLPVAVHSMNQPESSIFANC